MRDELLSNELKKMYGDLSKSHFHLFETEEYQSFTVYQQSLFALNRQLRIARTPACTLRFHAPRNFGAPSFVFYYSFEIG